LTLTSYFLPAEPASIPNVQASPKTDSSIVPTGASDSSTQTSSNGGAIAGGIVVAVVVVAVIVALVVAYKKGLIFKK
jgi:hypothetical protein